MVHIKRPSTNLQVTQPPQMSSYSVASNSISHSQFQSQKTPPLASDFASQPVSRAQFRVKKAEPNNYMSESLSSFN